MHAIQLTDERLLMMGERRRSRSLCLRVLLIALAIQGATPDVHDLSSLALLRLLRPVSDEGIHARSPSTRDVLSWETTGPDDGPAPARDAEDEMPDESCVPAWSGASLPLRPAWGGVPRHATKPGGPAAWSIASIHHCSKRPHDHLVGVDDLIHSLCRLTC